MEEEALERKTIPVTVDKSHLVTIGERLYAEKMSFVRELVNNAYDADATEVNVTIQPNLITIADNGNGMDEEGLRQYFTIGSPFKKENKISARFGRKRIGEFGIGKFAALAVAKRFEITTRRGDFGARLLFDKELWSRHKDWHLDIEIMPPASGDESGVFVALHEVHTFLAPGNVRRYLAEHAPIHAPNFSVFVNGERVTHEVTAGKRIPIKIKTPYGAIEGLLIITPPGRFAERPGVAVCVNGVSVKRESFGLDASRKMGAARITGSVNADFLPITSSRDDFIRSSSEFEFFHLTMRKEVGRVLGAIRSEADRRASLQASRALKDVLQRVGRAMRNHRNLFPETQVPLGEAALFASDNFETEPGFEVSKAEFVNTGEELEADIMEKIDETKKNKKSRGRPQVILGDKSVIRHLKAANFDIAVRMEHLGDQDESLISGGVIYVNLDHPLYQACGEDGKLLQTHLTRIITKELALKTGISEPRRVLSIQTELLTDALKSARGRQSAETAVIERYTTSAL